MLIGNIMPLPQLASSLHKLLVKKQQCRVIRQQLGGCDIFFNNERHQRPEKISWEEQRIPAGKAASHEIFSGRLVLFVVKKLFYSCAAPRSRRVMTALRTSCARSLGITSTASSLTTTIMSSSPTAATAIFFCPGAL